MKCLLPRISNIIKSTHDFDNRKSWVLFLIYCDQRDSFSGSLMTTHKLGGEMSASYDINNLDVYCLRHVCFQQLFNEHQASHFLWSANPSRIAYRAACVQFARWSLSRILLTYFATVLSWTV